MSGRNISVGIQREAQRCKDAAKADDLPRLNTNQAYVEEAARKADLDLSDPMAVFGFVLNSLLTGKDPYDRPPPEPLDEGTVGIGAALVESGRNSQL